MSYVSYVQPSKPGQHPKLLNSSSNGKPSPIQSVPPTILSTEKNKIAKEIEVNYFLK